jgi:hypothetical protein
MKAVYGLLILCLFPALTAFSQRCGFDILHQKRMSSDPAYKSGIDEQQAWIRNYARDHRNELLNAPQAALFTIPVVVHVIHTGGAVGTTYNPTDVQIQNAISYLNQVYDGTWPGTQGVGEIQINFVLATRDPGCNPTSGINRIDGSGLANYTAQGVNANNTTGVDEIDVKNLVRWDPYRYYNIWVVNRIDGSDGTSGSFIGGFAYFPGAPQSLDGTIMLATQMQPNRKTLPHEIGHAFSLYHPFQGASGATCPANTDCNTDGDEVCDTDPITQPVGFVCRSGNNPCTGTPFSINTESNYMNYTNCSNLFTADQKARMLAAASSVFRRGLHTSWGRSSTYPVLPFSSPSAASCTPNSSLTGTTNTIAGMMNVTVAGRNFNSGTTQGDNGYVPATSCLNLIQLVPSNTYTLEMTPLAINYEQVRAWIDYDNNGLFDNATEQVFFQNDIGPPAAYTLSVNGNFTVPAWVPVNTMLRMRVIEEVSTRYGAGYAISNACYNPTYGQAEDFPVWISAAVVLPVTYKYFTASASGMDVRIAWETGSESGSSHFSLERSSDGVHFMSIGLVPANGSGNGKVYQFTDPAPGEGTWFYRLRQVDMDGGYAYSSIARVDFNSKHQHGYKLMSNRVRNEIRIQFMGDPGEGPGSVRLVDLSGRLLLQRSVNTRRDQVVSIDLSQLPISAGVYLLEIVNGSGRHTEKIVRE